MNANNTIHILLQQQNAHNSTPGANIWNAAAQFFASYRDTEKSLVASPLTTDFSRTTDTSLSQVNGDASVGDVVGGKLQFDLHIRENKERNAIYSSRTSPVSHAAGTSMLSKKAPRDSGQDISCGKFSSGSSSGINEHRQAISSTLEHIYPYVIVQSPDAASWVPEVSYEKGPTITENVELGFVDSIRAPVIQVNLEADSDDTTGHDVNNPDSGCHVSGFPKWKVRCFSDDYIHQSEYMANDCDAIKYRDSIDSADIAEKRTTLGQPNVAKMAADNKLLTFSSDHKRDISRLVSKSQSTSIVESRDSNVDSWRHQLRRNPGSHRAGDRHPGQSMRLHASAEYLAYRDLQPTYVACANLPHWAALNRTCHCPVCSFNTSSSLGSIVSYASRSAPPSRDIVASRTCQQKLGRKQLKHNRSNSTNSEQSTGITHRKTRKGCSHNHKHKHSRMKQTSSTRSVGSILGKPGSSNDSDFMNLKGESYRCQTQEDSQYTCSGDRAASQSGGHIPTILPLVSGRATTPRDTEFKDLFQKVFSQEIDLDDFSLADEDTDFVLETQANSRESILHPESPCFFLREKDKTSSSNRTTEALENANSMQTNDSHGAGVRMNVHRNNVVTMLAGRSERISVSKSASVDGQQAREGLTSSDSCGTPTTCNVIVYDTNRNLDNHDAPQTVKSHFRLTRKHSSLDLMGPLRTLHTNRQSLRGTTSMQELSKQAASHDQTDLSDFPVGSISSRSTCLFLQGCRQLSNGTVCTPRVTSDNMTDTGVNFANKSSKISIMNVSNNDTSTSSSLETFSPQALRKRKKPTYYSSALMGCRQYLSVTDTDSQMSSTTSPRDKHSTRSNPWDKHSTCPSSRDKYSTCPSSRDKHSTCPGSREKYSACPSSSGQDAVLKDSAYQTKQSSLEKENTTDTRLWRPMTPMRCVFVHSCIHFSFHSFVDSLINVFSRSGA